MGIENDIPKPGHNIKKVDPRLEQLEDLKRRAETLRTWIKTDPVHGDAEQLADLDRRAADLEGELARESRPESHSPNTILFPTDPERIALLSNKLIQYQRRKEEGIPKTRDSILTNEYKIVIIQCLFKYKRFDLESLPQEVEGVTNTAPFLANLRGDEKLPPDMKVLNQAHKIIKDYVETGGIHLKQGRRSE